jgi:hypothetical protein
MYTFWCVLPDGRHNSISTSNVLEAPRRARALGAVQLFGKNLASGQSFELHIPG